MEEFYQSAQSSLSSYNQWPALRGVNPGELGGRDPQISGVTKMNHYKDVLICCIICKTTRLERLSVILFYCQILVARIKCYVMLCYVMLLLSQDPVVRGTESAVPKWLRP